MKNNNDKDIIPVILRVTLALIVVITFLLIPSRTIAIERQDDTPYYVLGHPIKIVGATAKTWAKLETGKEFDKFDYIIRHESGWKATAQNKTSTAYGLAQFLNGTWKIVGCEKTSNGFTQVDCAIKYMEQRYGSITKAQQFWSVQRWY